MWARCTDGAVRGTVLHGRPGHRALSTAQGTRASAWGSTTLRRGPEGQLHPAAFVLALAGQDDHRGQRAGEPGRHEIVGVLAGRANLDRPQPDHDRAGRVWARPGRPTWWAPTIGSSPTCAGRAIRSPTPTCGPQGTNAALERTPGGLRHLPELCGRAVIGVYGWIPGLHVALIAEQEEAEALGSTRQAL